MRRVVLAALLSLLAALPAQAQQTKSQLSTEIGANFPDNTSGLITPSILRTTVTDFVNSWQQAPRVNPQTGTTYTFVVGDYGFLVTFASASPVAATLPQATGSFATWNVSVCNQGAGAVTITPTTSTIGGQATLVIQQNQCRTIVSDGTNYQLKELTIQPITCAASSWINVIALTGVPSCAQPAFTDISGTLAVNKGGTGITSGTSGGVPYFSGATTIASSGALTLNGVVLGGGAGGAPTTTVAGTASQLLIGQAGAPTWNGVSGDASISTSGVWTNSKVNGVTYASSPGTNTVPVVTAPNTVTYEAVPNAALANSTITLNTGAGSGLTVPGSMSLGGTFTIGSASDVRQFAGITLTGALKPLSDTTGALTFTAANGTTTVVDIDTLNHRVGINKVPGAFDLDVSGGANVGGTFTFGTLSPISLAASTTTITGLTANNTPNSANDYFLYFSAADGAIRKCTVGACASAATAGVSALNGLTGSLTLNTGAAAGTGAGLNVTSVGTSITLATDPPPSMVNCSLAASVGSNLLTVALKDASGADPSAASACRITFRSATATSGAVTTDSVTSALSINTNATGATLGSRNSTAFRLWVVAFDNSGTVVPALYNASTGFLNSADGATSTCTGIDETQVQSSTAISGTATSAGVFYTPNGTTVTSKSVRVLGYVEYNATGLTTAGTYATAPNFVQVFGHGIARPCSVIAHSYLENTTSSTGTSNSFAVTATSVSYTAKSAANLIKVKAAGTLTNTSAATNLTGCVLSYTSNSNLFGAVLANNNGASATIRAPLTLMGTIKPNSISALTYAVYCKNFAGATTWTFPDTGPGNSNIEVQEIMG